MALTPFIGGRSSWLSDPFLSSNWALSPWEDFSDVLNDPVFMGRSRSLVPRMPRDVAALSSAAVDVKEDKESFNFVADLPGLKREEVKVQVEEPAPGRKVLSISGERKKEEKTETDTFHRVERSFGSFSRRFELPPSLDADKITAKVEQGVLHVKVPKKPEYQGPEAKTISIEGA